MIPPIMSSTLSGKEILDRKDQRNSEKNQNNTEVLKTEEKQVGRPEKSDTEKSDKTLANKEAMS